jgi:hypothetical protein
VALLCALLHLGLGVRAARQLTPTVDEFAHLPAGVAYWEQGRLDLYAKNPPLWKLWLALPVVADPRSVAPPLAETPQRLRDDPWAPWRYGLAFMNANRPHYFALFFEARLMNLIAAPLAGLLLFAFARRAFGSDAAGAATALFLLSPTLLAHGSLATLDAGCMLASFAALLAFGAALEGASPLRWALAGVAWGAALAIKFTAGLLLPAFVLLLAIRHSASLRGRRFGPLARDGLRLAACAGLALLVVNLAMGFSGSFRRLDAYLRVQADGSRASLFQSDLCRSLQRRLPGFLPVPLPEAYLLGFDAQTRDVETGEGGATYLRGRWSETGWWTYDLVALAVKEPVAPLLLMAAGAAALRRSGAPRAAQWLIAAPLGVLLLAFGASRRLDIGVRYLLPAFPLLYLLTAAALAWLWPRRRRLAHALAALAVGWGATLAVLASPDHLAWFNRLAGGPAAGPRWLLDSNLDWGQDLYRVGRWIRAESIREPIGLLYFGHVDPALYDIRHFPVPDHPVQGLLAVSVNFLEGQPYVITDASGRMLPVRPDHLAWLRAREPVRRLGSILVFDTRP